MKRMIVVLAVLLMAAPAMAEVTITAEDEGGGVVVIKMNNDEATGKVRAIALDINLTGGAVFTDVNDINTEYNIYPGSIVIDPCDPLNPGDGVITYYGSPVCDNSYPGTEGGIGTAGLTIEMASLYETTAPDQTDVTLCRVVVDGDCELCITENTIRGGIVMENPAAASDVNMPVCETVVAGCDCMGDIVDEAPLNSVTTGDAIWVITELYNNGLAPIVPPHPSYTLCADLVDEAPDPGITTGDAIFMVTALYNNGLAPLPCF
jgi:hypothetical protein